MAKLFEKQYGKFVSLHNLDSFTLHASRFYSFINSENEEVTFFLQNIQRTKDSFGAETLKLIKWFLLLELEKLEHQDWSLSHLIFATDNIQMRGSFYDAG